MKIKRTCFGQLIFETASNEFTKVELLTRLEDATMPLEKYFQTLSNRETLDLIAEQLEIARTIHQNTGLVSTINVPASLIDAPEDVNLLKRVLRGFARPLVLEFTETLPMPDSRACNRLFCELRDMGYQVALDDFGTGFNGMSIFADYDFDIVKIDRSLIMRINERPNKISLMKMVIEMVHSFGKTTVVEGVEDPDQIELVRNLRPNFVQGFFYHKPQRWQDLLVLHSQLELA